MATRRAFRQQGQRRKTSWETGPRSSSDGATIQLSGSSSVLGITGLLSLQDGITIVRIRGDLNMFLTLAGVPGDGFSGAFGIGLTNENAFAAGIGSVMLPITDEDWDGWLYHRYFGLNSGGPIAAATADTQRMGVNAISGAMHFEVDSKAMRKFDAGMVLYCGVEGLEQGAAAQMEWAFRCRTLIKLP